MYETPPKSVMTIISANQMKYSQKAH